MRVKLQAGRLETELLKSQFGGCLSQNHDIHEESICSSDVDFHLFHRFLQLLNDAMRQQWQIYKSIGVHNDVRIGCLICFFVSVDCYCIIHQFGVILRRNLVRGLSPTTG